VNSWTCDPPRDEYSPLARDHWSDRNANPADLMDVRGHGAVGAHRHGDCRRKPHPSAACLPEELKFPRRSTPAALREPEPETGQAHCMSARELDGESLGALPSDPAFRRSTSRVEDGFYYAAPMLEDKYAD
jgi:hypothetical protein